MHYFKDLDTTDSELIGHASSRREGVPRWTELHIYWLPAAGEGGRYGAVVIGVSDIEGEIDKVGTLASPNLERATSIFDNNAMARTAIAQAQDWVDAQKNEPTPKTWAEAFPDKLAQKEWTDAEALQALYGEPTGRKGYSGLIAEDFGVGESTVRAQIAKNTPIKVPLASVIAFMDIRAFLTARGKGDE